MTNMTAVTLILLAGVVAELLLTAAGLCFVRGARLYRVERGWTLAEQTAALEALETSHSAL